MLKPERVALDVADTRPLYRQVEDYIESLIHNDGLKPGEAIPSLTHLARTLGVNGLTVRRAIRELTYKRTLITLQGRGTFVAEGAVKRILWVSGLDLFSGDTSSYFSKLFQITSEECRKHSLRLEPVWLNNTREFDTAIQANGGDAAISGYFFCGCDHHHRLFNHVKGTGRPYISFSFSQYRKQRSITADQEQGDRMACDFLFGRGHPRLSLFRVGADHLPEWFDASRISLQPLPWHFLSQSQMEGCSYLLARKALRQQTMEKAIYVADNVAARGVSRAILELPARKRSLYTMVVQSALQEVIPLGIPIHYLVYDLAEQARTGLQMLREQIAGEEKTFFRLCPFEMIAPESPQLKAMEATLLP